MTHLTMDALLALREPGVEPGTAAAREHLDRCPQCQAELDRLHQRIARLKALPALRPPRDRWPAVAGRVHADRRRRRLRLTAVAGLAAAASVALGFAVGSLSLPTAAAPAPVETASADQISAVMERSQALESALDRYDPERRVLDGRTARIAQELEDRIAQLDRELEMAALLERQARDQRLLDLWRERVGLLDALVDVHVTRARNVGL